MRNSIKRGLTAAAFAGVFATGYLCGSVTQRNTDAQMGDVGGAAAGAVMKGAGEQGGALGSAAKLGSAIVDMQDHVSALQKNLDTLKGIKSALGG